MKVQNNTKDVLTLVENQIKPCKKLPMSNIVMPSLSEQGLMAYVFPGIVLTKEQPAGCNYGPNSNPILRIIGNQLIRKNQADAYAWDAATYAKKATKTVPLGYGLGATVESVEWANEIVATLADPTEKKLLIKFLIEQPSLRLIFSPEENRRCVEITQELYDAGLTWCVDQWMKPDENSGLYDATMLNVGDFLIIDEGVYCIRRDEFFETHVLH